MLPQLILRSPLLPRILLLFFCCHVCLVVETSVEFQLPQLPQLPQVALDLVLTAWPRTRVSGSQDFTLIDSFCRSLGRSVASLQTLSVVLERGGVSISNDAVKMSLFRGLVQNNNTQLAKDFFLQVLVLSILSALIPLQYLKNQPSFFGGSTSDVAVRFRSVLLDSNQALLYWFVKNEPALDAAFFADHLVLENRALYARYLPLLEHILEKRPHLLPIVQKEFLLAHPVLISRLLSMGEKERFDPFCNVFDCCRALAIDRPDVAKVFLHQQDLEVIDMDFLSAFCRNFDPAKGELSAKIFRGALRSLPLFFSRPL